MSEHMRAGVGSETGDVVVLQGQGGWWCVRKGSACSEVEDMGC